VTAIVSMRDRRRRRRKKKKMEKP